jgi:hypothetical protein
LQSESKGKDSVQIDVELIDLAEATSFNQRVFQKSFGKDEHGRWVWHTWRNPISRALERVYGDDFYASVDGNFVAVAKRGGRDQMLAATDEVKAFIMQWGSGDAKPTSFCFPLQAVTQF